MQAGCAENPVFPKVSQKERSKKKAKTTGYRHIRSCFASLAEKTKNKDEAIIIMYIIQFIKDLKIQFFISFTISFLLTDTAERLFQIYFSGPGKKIFARI